MSDAKLYPILKFPHDVLREVAKPVAEVDDEIRKIFTRMHATMKDDGGIGLSGNQVGILKRVITVDLQDGEHVYSMANPEIIKHSEETFYYKEGCLSFPAHYADVERTKVITVRYLDENNDTQEIEADDLLSICIQHEIDHLNGVLFIDHLSRLKRDIIVKKMKKMGGAHV